MECISVNEASIASFKAGMELCFRRAIEEGLGISIVPHLDDGGRRVAHLALNTAFIIQRKGYEFNLHLTAAWRNGLLFNPKQKYGGFSYQEVMLNPTVDALAAALAAKPAWVDPLPVWIALQGEMSATVLYHPREYLQLVEEMRERLLMGMRRAGAPDSYIKVGVSFNFNKVTQVNTGGGAGGGSAASVLSRFVGFGPFGSAVTSAMTGRGLRQAAAASFDLRALQDLFEKIDFLGISAYAALDDPNFPMTALQNAAFTFFGEMRNDVGLDAAAILRRRRIDLHYSEFGMGGGASPLGTVPARSPEQAARMPFYGIIKTHMQTCRRFPRQMKSFLHSFFRKTMDWLAQGGGPTYFVSHCFLWGMGSWDVLGIYPESTTPQGSYRDATVVQAVQTHNARAAFGGVNLQSISARAFNGGADNKK
ncbi:hypothetical protein VOLCADRAFT_91598 [Volvox carteri f. nagariensis]|uniref:Uncharacterized protein n=1 Tax=Volvox carteri f. nagariensis TaxID=3068 RepID=D8TXH9_VOLCA|nr:uncharacterized protein VOLCADRAFT_91598 [Volvox carteri f. nagariensis]EFJ48011.1 hypothetical protein VOLCADRAFT_91598 [Volvox carteri f. nagariensis]|eukprot:XP_002951117.1 hypothetical protein VOLCADRAFT_91598 [Volvox carteri f. nagariensis]